MKDGIYYRDNLYMLELFIFKNVDMVQVRSIYGLAYINKAEAVKLMKDFNYLGEL